MEGSILIIFKLFYEKIKNRQEITISELFEIISKNIDIEDFKFESEKPIYFEILSKKVNNKQSLFEFSDTSKEKITNIEELNLFESSSENTLKIELLRFFDELLQKTNDSALFSYISEEKTHIFQNFFIIDENNTKKNGFFEEKTMHMKKRRNIYLSCGDYGQIPYKSHMEMMEKLNEELTCEIAIKDKYEEELERKLSELKRKTSQFLKVIDEKTINERNTFDLNEKNKEFTSLIKRKNKAFLSFLEKTLGDLLKEGEFAELDNLKIVLMEKKLDLFKIIQNECFLGNDEIVNQEIDKTFKVLRHFLENLAQKIKELLRFELMIEKETLKGDILKENLRNNKENCKLCRLF